jgi:hypothetical protein
MCGAEGWEGWPVRFALALIVFPIGGYGFGRVLWRMMEGRYRRTSQGRGAAGEETP